jgi:hypothetical protein
MHDLSNQEFVFPELNDGYVCALANDPSLRLDPSTPRSSALVREAVGFLGEASTDEEQRLATDHTADLARAWMIGRAGDIAMASPAIQTKTHASPGIIVDVSSGGDMQVRQDTLPQPQQSFLARCGLDRVFRSRG